MQINKIICENIGPIESISINPRHNSLGEAVPIVIVGENGSGKSILLSQIVDAFYELAEVGHENVTKRNGESHEYYRTIAPDQMRINSLHMATVLEFSNDGIPIHYFFTYGQVNINDFFLKHGIPYQTDLTQLNSLTDKKVVITPKQSQDVFSQNVLCYFPPSRYEKPRWLGKDYFDEMGLSQEEYIVRKLRNPIVVNNITVETLQWLFNIIADTRGDLLPVIENGKPKFQIIYPAPNELRLVLNSRKNVERILSTILGREVSLRMQNRSFSGSKRICICDPNGNTIIPTLDSLSTGQMALFSIFSTIVRYADRIDANQSIHLDKIHGIVVIDEIDLHLHSNLQRNALGGLLKLFPNVQFIITTHSPLALLGLNEVYGDDLDIIEMPSGNYISAEEFGEFDKAYSYYTSTNKYKEELRKAIDQYSNDKPLIITEGPTDWRHFMAAYEALRTKEAYNWLNDLDFEFLKYDPQSDKYADFQQTVLGQAIEHMPLAYSRFQRTRKLIFIADNDNQKICNIFMTPEEEYKNWGNNVYSMTLPIPSHRKSTEKICVEHLYVDEDIKQWVIGDGYRRRIFIGNEFDNNGCYQNEEERFVCEDINACGQYKINIIDGSNNKKVFNPLVKDSANYALSKMQFAQMVLAAEKPFDKMNFDGFIPLFERIKKILNDENND